MTPETAAHQAPPSLGFSRQEHWSGLPFPSPMHESEKWKWSRSVMSDSLRAHGPQPTQAPPSMGFSRQEYWSGMPSPSPSYRLNYLKHWLELCPLPTDTASDVLFLLTIEVVIGSQFLRVGRFFSSHLICLDMVSRIIWNISRCDPWALRNSKNSSTSCNSSLEEKLDVVPEMIILMGNELKSNFLRRCETIKGP